jgi:hypothetical protein
MLAFSPIALITKILKTTNDTNYGDSFSLIRPHFLMNNTWIAIVAQLNPMYGLNLSPIRLIFHKNPEAPERFRRVSPGCKV